MDWTIIVPLKALPAAKARLVPVSADPQRHAALVTAIRADTLAAAETVGRVLLVVDELTEPIGPSRSVLVQVGAGLNAALREAAAFAQERWPAAAVAALVGDLPALTGAELAATLEVAIQYPRGFVADADGTGTTLLTALPGVALEPAFGLGSAARHAQIAQLLPAGPGLQADVDTAADLARARALGVGPATEAAARH